MTFIKHIKILAALLLPCFSFAQNYPVQITTQLVAPFSGYISDYTNPGEEKLKILFLFTDFTKPNYNIKLKISVQGQGITIQSKNFFYDGPHTLQPGIPFELSGSDLYNLLSTQNLDFQGISKAQYEQKKVLPEGFYSICVTAYDHNNPTPIQVSNSSCAQAWMVLSDPPFLNLPPCASTVAITNPQQQTFSFTQMNMGSPNSAATTEYVFELWEIRPQGAIANNIVQTTPPIYTYTTNVTMVNYGITEPPLLPGMEYAWRVKAQDISGRDYFKNNGYSQVCTFTYGSPYDDLNLNLNLHAQPVSQRQIKVWWDSLSNFSSYKLEFRKAGSNNWFPVNTPNAHVRILDLEPQTTYEFHVQGISNEYTSNFSEPVNATTQPMPDYQCGELPAYPTNTNFAPLPQANAGMVWQVGQFEMRVTNLLNTMSPTGVYSGFGKIRMPFINDIYCEFTNITVSNEQVVVQGKVNAVTQGIDAWVAGEGVGNIQDGTVEPEVHTNSPLTPGDIHVNTGNGTVVVGGNTYTYTPSGLTIQDSNGNLFIVTADGQIINAGTVGTGQGQVPDSKNFIITDKGVVVFSGASKQLYGIDKYKHPSLANYYLTVRNLTSDARDPVDWKSVMAQKYDVIDLTYQLQGNLIADSILFMTGTGTIYKPQGTGNNRQLYIIGGKHGDVQELFAYYRYSKDSLINIAKINLPSYSEEKKKVTLVPLGAGISIDKVELQKQLNEIYKQSVASWVVDVAPAITAGDTLWDKDGNGRLNVGSDLFSRYSSELKAINKYVRAQTWYKKGEYYLVVTNKPTDSLHPGLLGEMPRGKNIGYLFTSTPSATVVAHELGHGAFALEHSFEGNAQLAQGTSACLMDYNNGTELYKGKYWDYVHDPTTIIGLTEEDDDGAWTGDDALKLINLTLHKIKKSCQDDSFIVIMKGMCGYFSGVNFYFGGFHFHNIQMNIPKPAGNYVALRAKGRIKKVVKSYYDPMSLSTKTLSVLMVDDLVEIRVQENRIDLLKAYLEGSLNGKNLLIFSNGYRPRKPIPIENPDEPDVVSFADTKGYWAGIDAMFINQIGTRNVVYADGHMEVATSNHKSQQGFMKNMIDWYCATGYWNCPMFGLNFMLTTTDCGAMWHNPLVFKLNTAPNNEGFQARRDAGKDCGQDIIAKIKNGTIDFDPARDSIDIVSHSMGHAYAVGIIEALKASSLKLKFGRFYILAPENACSTNGAFDLGIFEEVWQYGSNEHLPTKVWEQDGIAPQCPVPGINDPTAYPNTKHGRIHFPQDLDPKSFLDCHVIVSYYWLFSRLNKDDKGYVFPRK